MADQGAFYDAGALRHLAINLFYGWGYNFYRVENQLRADDQLVRRQAEALLAAAVSALAEAEAGWRREKLPPPSRAQPLPDPGAVAGARALEALVGDVGRLKSRLASQPVPENDRMTQRYRNEADTLQRLLAADEQLIGQGELLRSLVAGRDGAWVLANTAELKAGLAAIRETLERRAALVA
ncbi:hypothetical protein ACO2Q3_06460 [Caulobacter sp. KR2-114]|uniref:hypothetical protein n=1 Tax=Caulobacter sp. KR2-114 TaxID=3400912 RepID=UPI003C0EC76E